MERQINGTEPSGNAHPTMAEIIVFQSVFFLLIVSTLIGNSLVCGLILFSKKMRNVFNYLLLNLAVADLTIGVLAAMFYVAQTLYNLKLYREDSHYGRLEEIMCKTLFSVFDVSTKNSIFTLALISIERRFAIMEPIRYRATVTKQKLRFVILGTWILALFGHIPVFCGLIQSSSHQTSGKSFACLRHLEDSAPASVVTMYLIASFLPTFAIVHSYKKILYYLWYSKDVNSRANTVLLASRRKVTKVLLSTTVAYNITWVAGVSLLISIVLSEDLRLLPERVLGIMLIFLLTSSINPIVYSIQSRWFRQRIKKLLKRKCKVICKRN